MEPNLTEKGRTLYAKGLETCLRSVCEIEDQFADTEKIQRLKDCIFHALDDVITVSYARQTAKTS